MIRVRFPDGRPPARLLFAAGYLALVNWFVTRPPRSRGTQPPPAAGCSECVHAGEVTRVRQAMAASSQHWIATLRSSMDRELRTSELLTAATIERDRLRAEVKRLADR